MQRIPEQFNGENHSEAFKLYRDKRYGAYGYSKGRSIAYGKEDAKDKQRFVENPSSGLREVGKAHDIAKDHGRYRMIDHDGWYIDSFQEDTAFGFVYRLPARDHKEQFVPAIHYSYEDNGAVIDFHSVTDNVLDACQQADEMARICAEHEREYRAKEEAKQRIEDNTETIKTLYANFRSLAREARANCDKLTGMPQLRLLIRSEYKRMRSQVRKLRAESRKIEQNGLEY